VHRGAAANAEATAPSAGRVHTPDPPDGGDRRRRGRTRMTTHRGKAEPDPRPRTSGRQLPALGDRCQTKDDASESPASAARRRQVSHSIALRSTREPASGKDPSATWKSDCLLGCLPKEPGRFRRVSRGRRPVSAKKDEKVDWPSLARPRARARRYRATCDVHPRIDGRRKARA